MRATCTGFLPPPSSSSPVHRCRNSCARIAESAALAETLNAQAPLHNSTRAPQGSAGRAAAIDGAEGVGDVVLDEHVAQLRLRCARHDVYAREGARKLHSGLHGPQLRARGWPWRAGGMRRKQRLTFLATSLWRSLRTRASSHGLHRRGAAGRGRRSGRGGGGAASSHRRTLA